MLRHLYRTLLRPTQPHQRRLAGPRDHLPDRCRKGHGQIEDTIIAEAHPGERARSCSCGRRADRHGRQVAPAWDSPEYEDGSGRDMQKLSLEALARELLERASGTTGDLLVIPDSRHSLEALEDSAGLLTVAKLPRTGPRRGASLRRAGSPGDRLRRPLRLGLGDTDPDRHQQSRRARLRSGMALATSRSPRIGRGLRRQRAAEATAARSAMRWSAVRGPRSTTRQRTACMAGRPSWR